MKEFCNKESLCKMEQLYGPSPTNRDQIDLSTILSQQDIAGLNSVYEQLKKGDGLAINPATQYYEGLMEFYPDEAWIQTYTGRRFSPTKPMAEAIVIQDIAHALSMQCRFSGHCNFFYSVAQHSVLVSYICDEQDKLFGLLHDASEAYLVDLPSPLKRSGQFEAYIQFEAQMQTAICKRFGLEDKEPESVKIADKVMLATEARDLLVNIRSDWKVPHNPLPFKIEPWTPAQAEQAFLERFNELINKTA